MIWLELLRLMAVRLVGGNDSAESIPPSYGQADSAEIPLLICQRYRGPTSRHIAADL